jgi:hypothetical protein
MLIRDKLANHEKKNRKRRKNEWRPLYHVRENLSWKRPFIPKSIISV